VKLACDHTPPTTIGEVFLAEATPPVAITVAASTAPPATHARKAFNEIRIGSPFS
jgi:hypothetical protein